MIQCFTCELPLANAASFVALLCGMFQVLPSAPRKGKNGSLESAHADATLFSDFPMLLRFVWMQAFCMWNVWSAALLLQLRCTYREE
ncbi:hypothetical protein B0J14DRAFT_109584 [Halenospora varia]|nr:hypothetical protein B0J14DRAFT_109584 [Halenospora varia]